MINMNGKIRLERDDGRILLRRQSDEFGIPVTLVWARPISGQGSEISLMDEKKQEVLMAEGLDAFDGDSRVIAEEELGQRYLMPRITRIHETQTQFGNRFWQVDTNHGTKAFVTKSPHKHVTWVSDDRVVLRDVLGNRYEIESLSMLDSHSRQEAEKVL